MKRIIFTLCLFLPFAAAAQDIDTTAVYRDREDTLSASVFSARQNTISKFSQSRVETINAAGLCKMACCNLAESFENSASVTVGYSDAVTGARQIRLLGLSGIYTQMLDENRPVMRGLASPFGLSYIPGQWLESIQIAKGVTSVINGVESMTGQINMEHRKPTDEKPLFVNASVMSDTKADLNVASSLQLNDSWSTVILGHVSGNFMSMDHNADGFLDDPRQFQVNLSNRWLYYAPSGVQVRFGVRTLRDSRAGGMADRIIKERPGSTAGDPSERLSQWCSDILNRSINGYLKVGVPLNEDNSQNIAAVLDYNYYNMRSGFGATDYLAGQHSGFVNLLYQNQQFEAHHFTVGLSAQADFYDEDMKRFISLPGKDSPYNSLLNTTTLLCNVGAFGEYTLHAGEKFSGILGLRGDWYRGAGFRFSPRLTLKYAPVESIVIRANAGRGLRYSLPLIDNIGVFSTSKAFRGSFDTHTLEDAWTFGGNLTYYFKLGASDDAYVSFDYFRSQFVEQKVVDYELTPCAIEFYDLSSLEHGRSFTDSYQLDFSCEPVERFTITLTGRYTNAKMTMAGRGLCEKPMTSAYKGVLNLQYATNLNKWIFDFTASVNGPCRVYDFMKDCRQIREKGGRYYSPVYPLLYLQVTKRFKGVDVYVGGENLTNFRQKDLLTGSLRTDGRKDTALPDFDASCIWGPIMGIKAYAGVRVTLWKTEK